MPPQNMYVLSSFMLGEGESICAIFDTKEGAMQFAEIETHPKHRPLTWKEFGYAYKAFVQEDSGWVINSIAYNPELVDYYE